MVFANVYHTNTSNLARLECPYAYNADYLFLLSLLFWSHQLLAILYMERKEIKGHLCKCGDSHGRYLKNLYLWSGCNGTKALQKFHYYCKHLCNFHSLDVINEPFPYQFSPKVKLIISTIGSFTGLRSKRYKGKGWDKESLAYKSKLPQPRIF